jgi:hypothetical protein
MTVLLADPSAPWYLKAGADALIYTHITGGTVGMISGATALIARKGSYPHYIAGTVFVIAMLAMATIGATVSPFLPTGWLRETPNTIAGVMTFYLVATSWMTIKRRDGGVGNFERVAFCVALAVCIAGMIFVIVALNSPTGTIGNTPPQAFYVFTLVGAIAAGSDLKVILKGGISGPARIARHLWRMCTALTVATGSFFLGQPKFLPAWLHGSSLVFVPVFLPLAAMVFWMVRVRIGRRFKPVASAA